MSAIGSSPQLVSGDVFAGKYRLERQFASGAMGFVWRAWNMQLDIPVAVKVMAAAMADSPELVARFELEARAAAQIRSPHVVAIYEHGIHERLPFIVMELLEGEDLSHRLKREKRLTMSATVKIVRDTCKALQRAHELGIVHRDIKPANVFLARDGDEEIVKVLDFGIAKLTHGGGGNMTATGEMMGTPNYMSPEHIRASKHVDQRADLWSVSVIAFRALTGHLPFSGHILDIVDKILSGTAPVPSSLAPDLSPAVDAFFARALTRDIGQRFQTARELSDALARLEGRESQLDASLLPEHAVEPDELPTIAVGKATSTEPTPALAAVAPEVDVPEMSTVLMNGRGSQAAFNASPGAGADRRADRRKEHLRTLPLDSAPLLEAQQALKAAQALVGAQAVAAASPWVRPESNRPVAGPAPLSRWWIVALTAALVLIAAALWASMRVGTSQEPTPAPLPAASVP